MGPVFCVSYSVTIGRYNYNTPSLLTQQTLTQRRPSVGPTPTTLAQLSMNNESALRPGCFMDTDTGDQRVT